VLVSSIIETALEWAGIRGISLGDLQGWLSISVDLDDCNIVHPVQREIAQ
jgi:hypothetical protein